MDLTIGQEEHKICYLIITVYLPNVRAVPADLQTRGLSHSLPELARAVSKEQQLVNPGMVQANLISQQFIIALTNCDESFPKVH